MCRNEQFRQTGLRLNSSRLRCFAFLDGRLTVRVFDYHTFPLLAFQRSSTDENALYRAYRGL